MSAAVIGRQLRQHHHTATTGRVSGPLVPPGSQYKGRPRTPSMQPPTTGRSITPAPASLTNLTEAEKRMGQFAPSHHEFYPHPAHREGADKDKEDKKSDDEPKLRCTWHCFCVALKALSGGIVLFILGTILSVVGFFAEPLATQNKGNDTSTLDPDIKTHLHNLTYVGPVMMGLGGIVIVAACVLTFEVRDTLGVKVVPVKPEVTTTITGKATIINSTSDNRKNTLSSITDSLPGKGRAAASQLTLPLATISDMSAADVIGRVHTGRYEETIQETSFCDDISSYQQSPKIASDVRTHDGSGGSGGDGNGGGGGAGGSGLLGYHHHKVSKDRGRYSIADECMRSPSSGTSHLLSPNIEVTYFGIPSPQETEFTDPDGCSLVVPAKWRSSRCSCSGSPTRSMSIELYMEDNDAPVTVPIVEHQEYLLQQQRLIQYQQRHYSPYHSPQHKHRFTPTRRPKVLASMESDGLSSSSVSSSSSDELILTSKAQQYCRNYVTNVRNPYVDHDQCDVKPLLANSMLSPSIVSAGVRSSATTSTSSPSAASAAVDMRFPLLRHGALGNGSVLQNTRR